MHHALALMIRLLCLPLLLFLSPAASAAAGQHALVIGNNAYSNVRPLQKAVGDAEGYAATLKALGFEVRLEANLTLDGMNRALSAFQDRLKPGDTAFFVFAGHGWSDGRVNYLLGTDAPLEGSDSYLRKVSIVVQNGESGVLDEILRRGVRLQVAVIDACRNNPFKPGSNGRSIGLDRGLAVIRPPEGTFLIQSAGFGQQALDRIPDIDTNRYSVFTRVFLPLLASGRPLESAINKAQVEVAALARKVDRVQTPAYSDEVLGSACLNTGCQDDSPGKSDTATEKAAYQAARATNTVASWTQFLSLYPQGGYAEAAGVQLAALSRPSPAPVQVPKLPAGNVISQLSAGDSFRDCPGCPEMVVIPKGTNKMGSPSTEVGRFADEGPQHPVTIDYGLAVGKYELTRGEFRAFVEDAGRSLGGCQFWAGKAYQNDKGYYWHNLPEQKTDRYPVVCISWDDAQAYARWLSQRTGKKYRLLSEAEWEYAARGGSTTARPWGNGDGEQCRYANGADASGKRKRDAWSEWNACDDGYPETSPAGSFLPNGYGLFDVLGNAWEWTEDCWHGGYRGAPTDGRAWTEAEGGDCARRVVRGGSWFSFPQFLRSADRYWFAASDALNALGFRLARTD